MKALIVYGGWDGHEPDKVAAIFEKALVAKGASVELSPSLDVLTDAGKLAGMDVIVMHWTMGKMSAEQWKGLNDAVRGGVGVAGVHGGAGDAFRENLDFQWMMGGQFVGHPHVGEYEVRLTPHPSPITAALPQSFRYNSEQYYQLVDPGNVVLADALYEYDGRRCIMPTIWYKSWGKGRVFYSALGHAAKEFVDFPHVLEMTARGILWAGERNR
jgi:type 1 glutamine amidotransferase